MVQRIFHIIPQTPCTRVSTFPPKPTGHLEQSAAVHSSSREISLSSRVSLRSYYRGFQAHCEASLTPTLYGITARSSRQVRVQFRAGKTFGFSPMSQSSSHPRTQHCFVYISSSIILVSHSLLPPPKRHLQGLKLEAHRQKHDTSELHWNVGYDNVHAVVFRKGCRHFTESEPFSMPSYLTGSRMSIIRRNK